MMDQMWSDHGPLCYHLEEGIFISSACPVFPFKFAVCFAVC